MAPTPVEVLGKMGSGADLGPPEVSQETQEGAGCGSVVPTVVPTPPPRPMSPSKTHPRRRTFAIVPPFANPIANPFPISDCFRDALLGGRPSQYASGRVRCTKPLRGGVAGRVLPSKRYTSDNQTLQRRIGVGRSKLRGLYA